MASGLPVSDILYTAMRKVAENLDIVVSRGHELQEAANSQPPTKKRQAATSKDTRATQEDSEPAIKGVSSVDPKLRPELPVEILDNIISFLPHSALKLLLITNSFVSALAIRRLYKWVLLSGSKRVVRFLNAVLHAKGDLALYIRGLNINIGLSHTTANFYNLLQKVLQRSTQLVSLFLELPKGHSPLWIFEGSIFKLQQFTTTMFSRRPLARFLETQGDIVDLTLRGYQNDSIFFLPFLDPMPQSLTLPESEAFFLSSEALPKLRCFNAVHADGGIVQAVVQDRPVEVVSIPLFPDMGVVSLDALKTSSMPLKRLSVISFDPTAPTFLLEALATRFTELEALHLVMLMAECTTELLEQFGSLLPNFTCLKYITFMAATPPPPTTIPAPQTNDANVQPNLHDNNSDIHETPSTSQSNFTPSQNLSDNSIANPSTSALNPAVNSNVASSFTNTTSEDNEEAEIARKWHKACPTLQTIILPKGKVWFQSAAGDTALQTPGMPTAQPTGTNGGLGGGRESQTQNGTDEDSEGTAVASTSQVSQNRSDVHMSDETQTVVHATGTLDMMTVSDTTGDSGQSQSEEVRWAHL